MFIDKLYRFAIGASLLLVLVATANAHTLPPSQPNPSIGVGSTSNASQGQQQYNDQANSQGQGQTQNAKGGKASATGGIGQGGAGGAGGSAKTGAINASSGASTANSSSGPASAKTGASSSSSFQSQNASTGASTSQGGAVVTDTSNSGNFSYREAANVVQPATMIIQGCQVQGQAGGSNTRGAAMLGIGFTPKNCYDYIQAQAYLAIGATQAACEILNHTAAAQRAVKAGATLPVCVAPPVAVVQAPQTYTREQVAEIVRKATSK